VELWRHSKSASPKRQEIDKIIEDNVHLLIKNSGQFNPSQLNLVMKKKEKDYDLFAKDNELQKYNSSDLSMYIKLKPPSKKEIEKEKEK